MARATCRGGRIAVALLATAHLALAAGSIGFLNGRAVARGEAPAPMAPQPNDTIPADYWIDVDARLAAAGKSTPQPTTLNDAPPTLPRDRWEKVMTASRPVAALDSAVALESLNDWEKGTPLPPDAMVAQSISQHSPAETAQRTVPVVSWDMEVGASLLHGLSEVNTPEPIPSQETVDQQFSSNCPMVIFSDQLRVHGPRCGSSLGDWTDPHGDRTVMRWSDDGGNLGFGMDSAETGRGSVTFASLQESFSVSSYVFSLRNCMGAMRYNIEEQIIRADHLSPHGRSTAIAHDESEAGVTILYRYIIQHPNGTTAAQTELFRAGQDAVNISLAPRDDEALGPVIASAARVGRWKRNGWRTCKGVPKGWALTFPLHGQRLEALTTVQDLRLVSAMLITLMAFRDEQVGQDGFQHVSQGAMYYSLVRAAGLTFLALVIFGIVVANLKQRGIDKKVKRFLFHFEQVMLPRRAVKARQPVLDPVY